MTRRKPDPEANKQSATPPPVPKDDARPIAARAQDHAAAALAALAAVLDDDEAPAPARISAAEAILNRGFGRPMTMVKVDTNQLDRFTDEQLDMLVALLTKEAEREAQ
jgi:hypothetical protein